MNGLQTRYLDCYNEYGEYCCDIGINEIIIVYQNIMYKIIIQNIVFYKADEKDRITDTIEEIELDNDYVYFLAVACVGCNCNAKNGTVLEVRVFA